MEIMELSSFKTLTKCMLYIKKGNKDNEKKIYKEKKERKEKF